MEYWEDLLSVAKETVRKLEKEMSMDEFIDKMLLITMLLSTSLNHAKGNDKEKCRKEVIEIYSQLIKTKAAKTLLYGKQ